jgi:tetratricopeptide (TPR) repeat protein
VRERLVEVEGRGELADDLARTYMNKAIALDSLGEGRQALPLYDRAIALLERLVEVEGRGELANDLARTYVNKANALHSLGEGREALPLYDRAIAVRERLVEVEGQVHLRGDLAWIRLYRAEVLQTLQQDLDELPAIVRQEMEVLRTEIGRTGRAHLVNVLRWAERSLAYLLYLP